MWVTDSVNICDEVIDSLGNSGNNGLVVFVGAGVSADPPSSLPTFDKLADQVSKAVFLGDYDTSEDPGEYFERLERQGLEVRNQVVSILGKPDSKPNSLHKAIACLFKDFESIRIVTTNYDQHLTTAIADRFGTTPNVYFAPALPLGRDFSGIVYLHGSLSNRKQDMVLTSRDFGRAYLTDAWATRFLIELFHNYTIVFIGYSHQDTVMKYLALGLRPGSKRYGFIRETENVEYWHQLDIQRIEYPINNSEHAELPRAIEEWGKLNRSGLLDHEERVKSILSQGQPQTPSNISYIEWIIKGDKTARFFTENAPDVAWLGWIEQRDTFPAIFDPKVELGLAGQVVADWFAGFAVRDGESALSAIRRHGNEVNEFTAFRVADRLMRSLQEGTCPESKLFGKWIVLLLKYSSSRVDEIVTDMLTSIRWPEDKETASYIFSELVMRKVVLQPLISLREDSVEIAELSIDSLRGEDYRLKRAWERFFRPHLADLVTTLVPMLEFRITEAHQILQVAGQASAAFDPQSFRRASIEPDDQDQIPYPFGFVFDCFRECLEHLITKQPEDAVVTIDRLEKTDVPFLKRMALHCWTKRTDMTADEKISHLISSNLLFNFAVKQEVFRLIASQLPQTTGSKSELLEAIKAGPGEEQSLGTEIDLQVVLDLLAYFAAHSADFPEAGEALRCFRESHPNLSPSLHPGYSFWIEPIGNRESSPLSVEELLHCETTQEIDQLIDTWLSIAPYLPDWVFGLNDSLATASRRRTNWAQAILTDIVNAEDCESRYLIPILSGLSLSATELADDRIPSLCDVISKIVELIPDHLPLGTLLSQVIDFLMLVVRRSSISAEALGYLERLGISVTNCISCISYGSELGITEDPESIFDRARDHWTGRLVEFWIGVARLRWGLERDSWQVLPEGVRVALETLLNVSDHLNLYPEAIMTANYQFFVAVDEVWALENIRPLFSWQDEARAIRAWLSFFDGGRLDERVLGQLRNDLSSHFKEFRGKEGKSLANRFAEIMIRSSGDYVSDGTLARFVSDTDEEVRVQFVKAVGWQLRQMHPDYSSTQWPRWISNFLEKRIQGTPRPLSQEEAAEMLGWVLVSGDHFPDAVSLYVQTHPRFIYTYDAWHLFENGDFIERWPTELAQLVRFILKNTERSSFRACDAIGILIRRFLAQGSLIPKQDLIDICESAAGLGCSGVGEWKLRIERIWGT